MQVLKVGNKLISTPIWDILVDIKSKLTNGKLNTIKRQGDRNIRVSCPHHKNGKEADPDCDIYIGPSNEDVQYGTAKCFACGYKSDFVRFVAECFDKDVEWAKAWLINNYADGTIDYQIDLEPIVLSGNKVNTKKYLDKSILDNYENWHPYMKKRKLTPEIVEQFEIKFDPKQQTLVFPFYDANDNLVGITRRSVLSKKFYIDPNINKKDNLYLFNNIKKNNLDKCALVEGQIDALTCYVYGIPAVATLGGITLNQVNLINRSGIRFLYTIFDNDDSGRKFTEFVNKHISKDIIVINVKLPDGYKDVNEMDKQTFLKALYTSEDSSLCY